MRKTLIGALILGVGGVLAMENLGTTTKMECMTFVAPHTNYPNPEITYTFREDNGKLYGVGGHPDILASLEEGERYRPTVTDPTLGDDRLLSATPCEETE